MRDKLIELIRESHCVDVWNYYTDDFKKPNPVTKLADLILADGWVRLPCKVGDKLYNKYSLLDDCFYREVIKFEVYDDEIWIIDDSDNCYAEKEIGKTVFLSREEAEKALEGVE